MKLKSLICQVFIKYNATSQLNNCENLSVKYIQQTESAISNLFYCRVPVIASIFWEKQCLNTPRKRISFAIIFSRPTLSIVEYSSGNLLFNTRVWKHKNQCSRFGKDYIIATQNYGTWSTTRITSIIAENKPYAQHESHLHTMKVVTILIPSFRGLR